MRIAFVTNEYVTEDNYDGGLANYLYRTTHALVEMGHHPVILVTSAKNGYIYEDGVEVHQVYANINKTGSYYNYPLVRQFFKLVYYPYQSWKLNQQLLIIHSINPLEVVQYAHIHGLGLFRPSIIPSIVRLSSYSPLIRKAYGIKGGQLQDLIETRATLKADGIFSPSAYIAAISGRALGRSIRVIESPFLSPNYELNYSVFQKYAAGKEYLLFFGTLGQLKGVGIIAEIIEQLFNNHPDLYFVFIGKDVGWIDGKPMIDFVRHKAGSYHNRIIYPGKLLPEYLFPFLIHARAVVLPSRVDNLPNTCIEAMAFGKIVIGTNGSSMEQLINDGESGLLCEVDHPQDLLTNIEKVFSLSPEDHLRIGRNARERISKLKPQIVVNQLTDFYQEVITKKVASIP